MWRQIQAALLLLFFLFFQFNSFYYQPPNRNYTKKEIEEMMQRQRENNNQSNPDNKSEVLYEAQEIQWEFPGNDQGVQFYEDEEENTVHNQPIVIANVTIIESDAERIENLNDDQIIEEYEYYYEYEYEDIYEEEFFMHSEETLIKNKVEEFTQNQSSIEIQIGDQSEPPLNNSQIQIVELILETFDDDDSYQTKLSQQNYDHIVSEEIIFKHAEKESNVNKTNQYGLNSYFARICYLDEMIEEQEISSEDDFYQISWIHPLILTLIALYLNQQGERLDLNNFKVIQQQIIDLNEYMTMMLERLEQQYQLAIQSQEQLTENLNIISMIEYF